MSIRYTNTSPHLCYYLIILSKFTIHRENEVSFQIKHFQQLQDFDLTAFMFELYVNGYHKT